MSKNAAGHSLVLHDFAKLLAKGKGEDEEEANRQLGQGVKKGPRKKKEELEVETVEVEDEPCSNLGCPSEGLMLMNWLQCTIFGLLHYSDLQFDD